MLQENTASKLMALGSEEPGDNQRYLIEGLLASGGMGEIYNAYDRQTDRHVAYKRIRRDQMKNQQLLTRFRYEAEITARLEHPNIIPVYDIDEDENQQSFYTMKLLKGSTLADYLKVLKHSKTKVSLNDLLEILVKVCDAIAFAHGQGVLHRDLKPDNIMLGDFGEVLILDWGLAKLQAPEFWQETNLDEALLDSANETLCGSIFGTPAYMSPEQASGISEKIDERSDVYSVGAILYNVLSLQGHLEAGSSDELLNRLRQAEPSALIWRLEGNKRENYPHLNERLPASAIAVCEKALHVDPEKRYQKVSQLANELRKIQEGFAVEAEEANFLRLLALAAKRHKGLTLACGFFVGLLSLVIWSSFERIKDEKESALKQELLAEKNAAQKQKVLEELKQTAPLYLERARKYIDQGKFKDALLDIETYLKLNDENAEAYVLLGRANQGSMQFKEAIKAFKKGAEREPALVTCATGLEISQSAWAVRRDDGSFAPDDLYKIYTALVNNDQLPEAAVFLDELLKKREYSVKVFNTLFNNSGLQGSLRTSKSGMFSLSLLPKNKDISALKYFDKIHFARLSLAGLPISDLSSLAKLQIRELDLSGTRISSLKPLAGTKVDSLNCANSRLQTLRGLEGASFISLNLSCCPIKDLSVLQDIQVDHLDLSGSPAKSLVGLKEVLGRLKSVVLPKKWQVLLPEIPKHVQVTWSNLDGLILD